MVEHGAWLLRWVRSDAVSGNLSPQPKNSPQLAHGTATFGAVAGLGEAVNRTAPGAGGRLTAGTPRCAPGRKPGRGTVALGR